MGEVGGGPGGPSPVGEGLGVAEPRGGWSQGMEEFLELLGGHFLVGVDDVALVLVLRQ